MRRAPLILVLGLAGCAGQASVDRWSRVEGMPAYAPPTLMVSSAPAGGGGEALTVKGLPERAAAAYIQALAAKEKASADLRAALAKGIGGGGAGLKDTTIAPRVLVVGIERQSPRPGDRLLSTVVSIRPAGSFRFTDYQLAATDRSSIDIGQVSVSDTRSASVGVAPGAAPTAEGLTADLSVSRTRTGSRTIRGESDLSVDVSPDLVRLYRTGVEGRDLTGDALVKLSLRLPQAEARTYALADLSVRDDKGEPVKPDKMRMGLSFVALEPAQDLYVCAKLAYEDRTILETDAKTYDEGRQAVELKTGETPWAPYLVASAEELETPLWVVEERGGGALAFDDGLQVNTLTFGDYDLAVAFLAWLTHERVDHLANGRLMQSAAGVTVPIANYGLLAVHRLAQTRGVAQAPTCDRAGAGP